ncbi:MAG: PspA/IM30 family protein [Blautia sp.]|nr:PspA/IM30 family protein [Lachnoclostridium sp.]MCM1212803.1 PspA/IM30 family protein [Blautia sp.]
MGVMTRFKDIMAANFNALLDRCEDPEKMIDQYLRNLEQDFAKVKAETASIMAEEKNARRKLDDCEAEIARMGEYAKKAVAAGNDGEARQFLEKKAELAQKQTVLSKNYELARENSAKMRQMHDKLEGDISSLKSRREMLKAKVKVAETQKKMSQMGSGLESAGGNLAAFDRMEEKVNKMLDEADAMNELNAQSAADDIDALTRKYDAGSQNTAVDDELAALKAEMGM